MTELFEESGALKKRFSIPLALTALYAPQLWLFFVNHPMDEHWMSYLRLFPGLPVFAPMVSCFLFAKGRLPQLPIEIITCIVGLLVVVGLIIISRKYPKGFWFALAVAMAASVWSAIAAYSSFSF